MFVCRIQQHARRPGGGCYIQDARARQAFVLPIGVRHQDDAGTATVCAAHGGARQRERTRAVAEVTEADFDQAGAAAGEHSRIRLDGYRRCRIPQGRREGPASRDRGRQVMEHVDRHGAKRAPRRVFGIHDVGASVHRCAGIQGRRAAHEQVHQPAESIRRACATRAHSGVRRMMRSRANTASG